MSVAGPADRVDSSVSIIDQYSQTRNFTDLIVKSLSAEDCMVQSMDDVSPTRWHLAHTTWFFETFVLKDEPNYQLFDESFHHLFNSYYNTLGNPYPRSKRGLISRPSLNRIKEYRSYVDEQLLLRLQSEDYTERVAPILQIGIQHEQQHQELILTDIKHVLFCNPLFPAYQSIPFDRSSQCVSEVLVIEPGTYQVGHSGEGFAFDNEGPQHRVYLNVAKISRNLVTCGEYLEFMEDGGYQRSDLWLSLGWSTIQQQNWNSPLYWLQQDGQWMQFTLAGLVPIDPHWPVCHISLFEADAYARWAGKRLPTEFEWEVATVNSAEANPSDEPFVDYLFDHGYAVHPTRSPVNWMGGIWQWTSSSYQAYPGYAPPAGAIGEYNGKFMCNQYVLRGGSVATHRSHIRPTYRNFFPAETRWQFSGIRLAE